MRQGRGHGQFPTGACGQLRSRIAHASCVLAISGMYAAYSKWIDFELETAREMGKPILGVKPWGQERIPVKIRQYSDKLGGRNRKSVVTAIQECALQKK